MWIRTCDPSVLKRLRYRPCQPVNATIHSQLEPFTDFFFSHKECKLWKFIDQLNIYIYVNIYVYIKMYDDRITFLVWSSLKSERNKTILQGLVLKILFALNFYWLRHSLVDKIPVLIINQFNEKKMKITFFFAPNISGIVWSFCKRFFAIRKQHFETHFFWKYH